MRWLRTVLACTSSGQKKGGVSSLYCSNHNRTLQRRT